MKKLILAGIALLLLCSTGQAQIRFTAVAPAFDAVTIHNFGSATVDISSYWFCHQFSYHQVSNGTIISGSSNLGPGEDLVLTIASSMNLAASDMCLYSTPSFSSSSAMVDFTQWGSGGNGRENVAVAKGIWTAGTFVPTSSQYYYNVSKKGAQDGVVNWGTCAWPFDLREFDVQDTHATLRWQHPGGAQTYKVKYKVGGSGSWTNATFSYNNEQVHVTGLTAGTQYAWAVEVNCGGGWGNMQSLAGSFTTLDNPCNIPSGLGTPIVRSDKAKVDWAGEANSVKYRIRYRIQGSGSWTTTERSDTVSHKWLTGLTSSSTYEWQIKNVCQQGTASGTAWSSTQTFATPSSKWSDGVRNESELAAFRVFPNPSTNGAITISLAVFEETPVHLTVTNMLGSVVNSQQIAAGAAQSTTVDMSTQPAGLYFVRAVGENIDLVEKVVVQ